MMKPYIKDSKYAISSPRHTSMYIYPLQANLILDRVHKVPN